MARRGRRTGPSSLIRRWLLRLWASPNTLIGLSLGLLLLPFGARLRLVDGVIEIAARRAPPRRRWPFTAITFGHVVLGTHAGELQRLRAHERVHVRQCERWGPLFLPAYLLAGAWQWLRGQDAYRDNPFEVEARRVGGGEVGDRLAALSEVVERPVCSICARTRPGARCAMLDTGAYPFTRRFGSMNFHPLRSSSDLERKPTDCP